MRREVIEEARHGDTGAFETLAGSVIDRLYGAAVLILHDRTMAEDAVQETLIRAWRDLPRLRDPERIEPWLHRVLLHACLDLARRERPLASQADVPVWAGDGLSLETDVADRDAVRRGLRRLPPGQRGVLVLRYFLDLSVPQIADALRVPLGTAKSRLHHAQQAMRAAMDADGRAVAAEGGLA
jgi:RNA polymerase sigma factor (sigma-70 family)